MIGPDNWNIRQSIVTVTSDSASVMVKAAEIAGMDRVACFAHCLHNSVTKALNKRESLCDLVERCHNLVKFFHCSTKMAAGLEAQQQQIDPEACAVVVVTDVVTRWNSTLHMMDRLLRLRMAIDLFLDELGESDKPTRDKLKPLMLKQIDWDIIAELVKVLRIIENMTLIFSSESKGFAASLYPWVASVLDELTALKMPSNVLDHFRHDLKDELEERFKLTDIILTASVFHPSFNLLLSVLDPDRFEKTKERVQAEYDRLVSQGEAPVQYLQGATASDGLGDEEGSAIHRLLKRQRTVLGHAALQDDQEPNEVERYFSRTLTYKPVDPLEWWRHNKTKFPVMAKIARKYLAIPATSVASERMFSFAGGVCTDRRNRLSDDTVSDIVFCNYASRCLTETVSRVAEI